MSVLNGFNCRICLNNACTMSEAREVITNEMCGCTYTRECFEQDFHTKTRAYVLAWDFNHAGEFRCRERHGCNGFLREVAVIGDMVQNQHYHRMWVKFQQNTDQEFDDLVEGCQAPFTALVPDYLREVYKTKIENDRRPREEHICFGEWNNRVKQAQGRVPAYGGEWGICEKTIFLARCIYHTAIAVISEVGLYILSFIVSSESYKDWRAGNVGDRITELYMNYYGCDSDYSRPRTFENRFIGWLCGE